jgi:hypothetical protein
MSMRTTQTVLYLWGLAAGARSEAWLMNDLDATDICNVGHVVPRREDFFGVVRLAW